MSTRQRGACWLLLALLVGRLLDALDLPFEAVTPPTPMSLHPDSVVTAVRGVDSTASRGDSVATPGDSPTENTAPLEPLAINHASAVELQSLPRVGPVLASRIVSERQQHGPFRSVQDLLRVPGIGPRTAARLAPLLRFD